ncbi:MULTISPECIES: flagellar motor protein MotB [unclassified Herbaspirillum]|jgi:chemotaxis protein MotB|uniref:flagellar motor protein MotB n=1 Tax=unclassified Herbaspirillum TaxID=2624150 RepID=UPI000E2FB94D|nr:MULTISPECIES: flagellar motor protein MotB [unclassified Herbaspirillum]RFB68803.1 motility protein MotB [Herbaspirillum sp. 3R-3a1]TFI05709.1 flagellar motor protein MotB [Herbaspirillum sp. 3R11]TFI13380.1 flagellar motor protein MotB [Herbaspirillum sp. 3R-11]TFI27473.1 flagellar motor protein MotB [Herbaspirillum sp. 3C11]
MADEGLRPIIVKRIKKGGGGHHGGAWKIAYADFVTAMMAFFLLMWLLGSTAKGDLNGIAEYFKTPLKVAMAGGSGSGDANTVLPGGGKDLTRQEGQLRKGENDVTSKRSVRAAQAELEKAERARLDELKKRIETAIDSSPTLKQFKNQLLIDITSEGLRIQIVDEKNRPMFALASAQLQPYTREILREIGKTLNDVPNKISLSGHTDATPYSSGEKGYSNWELSADRANASRRELISGGMDESKVLRVVGLSSAVLLDKEDPFNPINRRISIIVMNKKAEELVQNGGSSSLDVSSEAEVKDGLSEPAKN